MDKIEKIIKSNIEQTQINDEDKTELLKQKLESVNNILKKIKNLINDDEKYNEIEKNIYKQSKHFCKNNEIKHNFFFNIYMDNLNKIYSNLDETVLGNTYFLNAVKDNKINLNNLCFLKPNELFPENWSKIEEKLKYIKEKEEGIQCIIRYCKNCKRETKTSKYMLQTRGCDEPMTTFQTCLECERTIKY